MPSLPATLLSTTTDKRIKTERGRRLKSGFARNKHQSLSSEHTAVPVQKCKQLMPDALESLFSPLGKLMSKEACRVARQPTQKQASSHLLFQLRTQRNYRTQMPEEKKKRKAPIILRPQEQWRLKAKTLAGQQKGKAVQNSGLKKLCCFSQQPLRQTKKNNTGQEYDLPLLRLLFDNCIHSNKAEMKLFFS